MHTTEPQGDEELRATVKRLIREAIERWMKEHPERLKLRIALRQKVAGITLPLSKNGKQ